jgi:hypothetical protein
VDLEKRNRSAPEKLELAARLRRETTLTIREIAQGLHMGSWKSAITRLHRLTFCSLEERVESFR